MKDSISHLHLLCQDWTRELEFYKSELPFLRKRLDDMAAKNTSVEVRSAIEHFENKFRIMDLHFDHLLHDMKLKVKALLLDAANKPKYINVKMIENDNSLCELMEFTSADFNKTRKEFYALLSKYL